MKYEHGHGEMKHKHMAKHDGGHQSMESVNEPAHHPALKTIITTHQEHEEGGHVHTRHHFGGLHEHTEHEHNKD